MSPGDHRTRIDEHPHRDARGQTCIISRERTLCDLELGLPRASILHTSQGSIEKFDQTPRVLTGGVQVGPEVRDADPEQPP